LPNSLGVSMAVSMVPHVWWTRAAAGKEGERRSGRAASARAQYWVRGAGHLAPMN
jgi:hypothetical protein